MSASTVAELADRGVTDNHPNAGVVADLRRELEVQLGEVTSGWQGPGGSLGITKNRVLATARCPASVLAEAEPLALSEPLVMGALLDVAASMLLVSDKVPGSAPWLGALMPVIHQTEPEQADFIESLDADVRHEMRELVEQKAIRLVALLGDLRSVSGTAQEMFRVDLDHALVSLTGRTDLILGRGARTIVEVKSGAVRPAHVDECGFYALLHALRDGVAPRTTAVVTLDPGVVTEYPVTVDSLEAAARRVVSTARELVEIDAAVVAEQWPRTIPGEFCAWCGVVQRCPDAPDLARAEALATIDSPEPDDVDHEPW